MRSLIKTLVLPITFVSIALGFLVALQVQTQKSISEAEQVSAERMAQMRTVLANSQAQNAQLKESHHYLLDQLDTAKKQVGTDPELLAELAQLQMLEGTQTVEGPGVHISIDDRSKKAIASVNPDDIASMINTLRFAGAEAISVNGQRVVSTTAVVLSGSVTILVNEVPINRPEGVPFELNAIGDQDTLVDYFSHLEATALKQRDILVSITRKTVRIPAYKGTYSFKYAKQAPSDIT